MASKPKAPTSGDAAQIADAIADAVVSAVDIDAADEAPSNANPGFLPMIHPNNGSCDLYETDASGAYLVPYADIETMQSHGFVVASEA